MAHNEAWHFCRLGRMLERAEKTSRMLDVKYYILLRSADDVGSALRRHPVGGGAPLGFGFRNVSQTPRPHFPQGVVEFLILDREFPRAIQFCLVAARDSFHAISGTPLGTFRYQPEKLLGQLCSDLSFASLEEIIAVRIARIPG